jgi:hypothetical protein
MYYLHNSSGVEVSKAQLFQFVAVAACELYHSLRGGEDYQMVLDRAAAAADVCPRLLSRFMLSHSKL